MSTPHVTIRVGAPSAALIDPPQDTDAAAETSEAGGRKRHDTPFSFDIVFEPPDDGTPSAERGSKGRSHTPFTFEITAPGLHAVVGGRRLDTPFSFDRGVPPTDGGLMLAAIRESIGISVEALPILCVAVGRARTHTTSSFEVSAGDSGAGTVSMSVSGEGGA